MFTQDPGSDGLYNVDFTVFAEAYYVKVFRKRYGRAWDVTRRAIVASLQRADSLAKTTKLEVIHKKNGLSIAKLEFAVAGRKESAKSSGNRGIVFIDTTLHSVKVLLIYSKNEISSPNETSKWQTIVKENYPDVWRQFFSE